MREAVLTMLLTVAGSSAMAGEWIAVSYTDEGGITVYADPSTIHREGGTVSIWTLGDFKKAERAHNNELFSSLKEQYAYNCKEGRLQRLYSTYHSKNMGRGEVVYSSPIHEDWQPVLPGSMNEQLWKFACSKK